jgi:hypothetical protein
MGISKEMAWSSCNLSEAMGGSFHKEMVVHVDERRISSTESHRFARASSHMGDLE